uniref:PHD-type domain-containing protein n=1 Tax=Trichobilharzia regenti TaxID=157069 RepID=A0AA85K5A1_TRIRE|nr:unnamed protein product [Trichobilharzia regenti]
MWDPIRSNQISNLEREDATPSTQQPKRIVFTPSRFDPSATPSWSGMRRVSSSSRASLFSKHTIGENSRNKRQASSLAYVTAPKVPRLSTGCRVHRRSKTGRGRARRLSKQRFSKSNASSSSILEEASDSKNTTDQSLNPAKEIPDFKDDAMNAELSPLDSDVSTLSNGMDSFKSMNDTPTTIPEKVFSEDRGSNRIDSEEEKQTVWNGKNYPECESPSTPPLRNPVNNDSLIIFSTNTNTTPTTTDMSLGVITSLKQAEDSKSPGEIETTDLKVLNVPEKNSPMENSNIVQPKPTYPFRRKGRGRRRDKYRVSAFNSLFQNPLRPNSSKSLSVKSNDVPQSLPSTPLSKPESNFGDQQPIASTPIGRSDISRQTRSVYKLGKRSVDLKADSFDMKSESITMSPPMVNENEIINSPASDTTEPMTYAERAELLRIPFSDANDVKGISSSTGATATCSSHFLKSDTSVFNKESFGKLQQHASAALRSLPSSPSSLDSSLCSSSSSSSLSTPKIPPEEPLATKLEVNDTKSDNIKYDIFRSNPDSNKSLFPNPCIQTTVDTNLLPVISPSHMQPSPAVSCINTISTTYRSLPSPIQPAGVGPPPLLPLSNKLTEQKSCVSSYPVTSKENECVPVLPPTLVPSCVVDPDYSKLKQTDSVTASRTCFLTNSQSLSSKPSGDNSNNNGGLRITIKLGGSALKEELASSLSPTSSSSSLSSSGSTSEDEDTATHYTPALNPIHTVKKESNEIYLTKDRSDGYTGSLSQSTISSEKTPKLVIRFGNGPVTSVQSQSVTSSHVQSDGQSVTPHSENPPPLIDRKYPTSLSSAPPPPPPPLQLTISRDRLKYRGRTASQGSDSNASNTSSTITGSLSSSEGEEEEKVTVQPQISPTGTAVLPPPPCLERLPPRSGQSGLQPNKITTEGRLPHRSQPPPPPPPPSLTSSVSISSDLPPLREKVSVTNGPDTSATHCHLPPLLPLFNPVGEEKGPVSSPLPHSDIVLTHQSSLSKQSKSNSRFVRGKKRSHSDQSSHFPLAKRRAVHQSSRTVTSGRTESSAVVQRPRATVDSVFTDDESDVKNDDRSPLLSPVSSIEATDSQRSIRTSNSRNIYSAHSSLDPLASLPNSIPPPPPPLKTQPRTKHTSLFNKKSLYRPATKSSRNPSTKSSTLVKSGKSCDQIKPIPVPPIATPQVITSKIVPRETASQIVVESAGSSYYFNNNGEQIWLCPICLLEDDGNLMIGCDSCEDWYHSTCLGLTKAPEVPQWFCPKCSHKPLPANTRITSKTSVGGPPSRKSNSHIVFNSSHNSKHSERETGSKKSKSKPKR